MAHKSSDDDAPRVELLFVRFKEDEADVAGLAEVVFHQLINYAIPRRKVIEAFGNPEAASFDASAFMQLVQEARDAFISYNASNPSPQSNARYSEIGEVIAFCIASHFLDAPQIAAKMALKTSSEMPVYGLDGVHARAESDGTLTVFYLESKLNEEANAAAGQYAVSESNFEKHRKLKLNEYRIARDLSNLDSLETPHREIALEYFNPYTASHAKVRERYVGVLTYSEKHYDGSIPVTDATPLTAHQENFRLKYLARKDAFKSHLAEQLAKKGGTAGKSRAFYLAVPDVQELRDLFAKAMTGQHVR